MTNSIHNFHRFYALLNALHREGDKEDLKATLVDSFTDGRTIHLREMSVKEYNAMCTSLEEQNGYKEELRKKRSICLKLLGEAGVDTKDWQHINDFCMHPRIAGKVFARLKTSELDALQLKLRAIIRKQPHSPTQPPRRGRSADRTGGIVLLNVGNLGKEAQA